MSFRNFASGKFVRGYLATDNLTSSAAIPLFDEDGVSVTLSPSQKFVLYGAVISNGATASVITLFNDVNANGSVNAGEQVTRLALAVNGHAVIPLDWGVPFSPGVSPRAVASAASANTTVTLFGEVVG